jgi:hypothetical protein
MQGIGNTLQQVGELKASAGLFLSPILAIIFCCIGWWIVNASKGDGMHTKTIAGLIKDPSSCRPNSSCNVPVYYTVNGKDYSINASVVMGDTVNLGPLVAYNPNNPADALIKSEPPSFIGYIFICIGFLVPLIAFGIYYLTTHSKIFAQVQGAETLIGGFRGK